MSPEFHDLVDVETARRRLASLVPATGTGTVPLDAALGRVLVEPVDAPIDVPGFDRAAMDGFAVRADDTVGAEEDDPVRLTVAGTVHPGREPAADVGPDRAVDVSTGAVLPATADAVVMVEDTERRDEEVLVRRAVAPGDNVMPRGDDVAAGERVLPRHRHLDPRDVALLAALGVDRVPVVARPTVAVVSTGDEIRPVDEDLGPGEIHDVNRHSLTAAIRRAGGDPEFVGRVGDDEYAMAEVLDEAIGVGDLVLTSGSTSASRIDVLDRVVADRGRLLFHGVDVKPGKPMFAATVDGVGVVGLPGYPVSAQMTFRLFVAPLIRQAIGRPPEPGETAVEAVVADRVRTPGGRPRQLPVGLVGTADGLVAYPVDRGSGATTSLVDADGVVLVPGTVQRLDAGERVDVRLLTEEAPPDVLAAGENCPAIHALLDHVEADVRWLRVGAEAALRQAGQGLPDVVGSNVDDAPDGYGVAASWRRRLGVASADGLRLADLDGRRVARFRPGTGMRRRQDALAAEADVEPVWIGANRSHDACVRAIGDGTVEAAVVLEAAAGDGDDLAWEPATEETYRLWVRDDRRDKPGVQALLEAVTGPWRKDAEEITGIRPDTG